MTNTTNTKNINRKDMFKNIAIIALTVLTLTFAALLICAQPADAAEMIIQPEPIVEVIESVKVKVIYVDSCNHDVETDNDVIDNVIIEDVTVEDNIIVDSETEDFDVVEDIEDVKSNEEVDSDIVEDTVFEETDEHVEELPEVIIPNDDEDDLVDNGMEDEAEDDESKVESDVVIEEIIIPEIIIPEIETEISDDIKDDKKEEVIVPEVPVVQMPVKSFTTTKFVTANGDIVIEYDGENQELIDNVIHDILYFMIQVEFDWNGEYATLTITGKNVVYYSDRVEVDGVRIATLYGAEAFTGSKIPVIAMYTEFAN
jgi:hypothetical protein